MLRRRRRENAEQRATAGSPAQDDLLTAPPATGPGEGGAGEPAADRGWPGEAGSHRGPWDSGADYPDADRIDCGSLLIPVTDGMDVQINVSEEQGIWVAVVCGDSGMQLQAFAAPRREGLWDEVRREISDNVGQAGGTSQETDGPFGAELHARIRMSDDSEPGASPQPVRFLGVDGPRWFLRGLISGPAAEHPAQARPFEEIFREVVVVRGEHPKPPKEQLEIRLPDEARQALEAQLSEEGFELPEQLGDGPQAGTG